LGVRARLKRKFVEAPRLRGFIREEVGMGALEEVRDLAGAVARRRSLTLWDVELGGRPGRAVVRVFVDAEDGIDLDTVAEVSEELSRGLDLRDPIPGRYTLEVSSPGLERTLRSPEHWRLSVGSNVVVKTIEPLFPAGHRAEGTILEVDDDKVVLETPDGNFELPHDVIRSARTIFEWTSNGKGGGGSK
jgi:ribosome maturation factor RimP